MIRGEFAFFILLDFAPIDLTAQSGFRYIFATSVVIIVDSVINFTPNSVRLGERPYQRCADIFGLYYKVLLRRTYGVYLLLLMELTLKYAGLTQNQ